MHDLRMVAKKNAAGEITRGIQIKTNSTYVLKSKLLDYQSRDRRLP